MDGLALYGAIVATFAILLSLASLGWQIYSWRRDRSTNVEVKLTYGVVGVGPQLAGAVIITAINHSRHPIRINSAGLELQDGSGNWTIKPSIPNGAGLPGVVSPNDSADTWWFMDEIKNAKFDLRKPLVARVVAGNDQRFRSKRTTIRTT